jgi:hypothetical protein
MRRGRPEGNEGRSIEISSNLNMLYSDCGRQELASSHEAWFAEAMKAESGCMHMHIQQRG